MYGNAHEFKSAEAVRAHLINQHEWASDLFSHSAVEMLQVHRELHWVAEMDAKSRQEADVAASQGLDEVPRANRYRDALQTLADAALPVSGTLKYIAPYNLCPRCQFGQGHSDDCEVGRLVNAEKAARFVLKAG